MATQLPPSCEANGAEVASILPHAEVVYEWEFAGPVQPTKAWTDVAKAVGSSESNETLYTTAEKLGRLNV